MREVKRLLRWRTLAVVLLLVVAGAAFGFPRLVRDRARTAAARYGAEVEIDWVVPTWGGVELRGVALRHPEVPGATVALDEVRVGLGSPRRVVVQGGRVELSGSLDDLLAQAERARAAMPKVDADGESDAKGVGTDLELSGLEIRHSSDGLGVVATGVSAARTGAGWKVEASSGKVTSQIARAEVEGGSVSVERSDDGWRVTDLRASALVLAVDLGGAAGGVPSSGDGPEARSAKVGLARRAIARLDADLSRALGAAARVELEGVRAEVKRGGETLAVGPATLRLRREAGRTHLEYLAGASAVDPASSEGLVVRTKLPVAGEPFGVEVRGGPIALATLGVREGDLRIVDPSAASLRVNARVEVDEHGEVGSFDGEASVSGLGLHVDELAKEPVRGLKASFRGRVRAALDRSNVTVQGGEIEIGTVRLLASLELAREPAKNPTVLPRYRLDARYEVPLVPCQALLDAAPAGLLPTIQGMRLAGSFSLKGTARVDTQTLDRDFDVRYDLASSCRVTDVPPAIEAARFKKAFKLNVYAPEGEKALELETGPGTGRWVSYNAISRFMEPAVMTCEDGRFHRHEGFDHEAIRNSIRENIRQRKFVRGASTISMQLAKNLYLSRDKRLSRKIEEAFLTMYLEQELTKEQMMELYLNVVEFGPKVYGVEAAAEHYFRTSPSRLTVTQAFYLASILPAPRVGHFGQAGALSPGWLRNLRTLMKHANKVKRLSDEDLDVGLSEIPLRGSPAPMRDPDAPSRAQAEGEPPVLEIEAH